MRRDEEGPSRGQLLRAGPQLRPLTLSRVPGKGVMESKVGALLLFSGGFPTSAPHTGQVVG
jgi:hypothetical protein